MGNVRLAINSSAGKLSSLPGNQNSGLDVVRHQIKVGFQPGEILNESLNLCFHFTD